MSELWLQDYALQAPVGRGGMGVVWRARHTPSGQLVAVKVIAGRSGRSERFQEALRNEVQAVAALDHPAILGVLDVGTIPLAAERRSSGRLRAGRPWVAMELASGGTVESVASELTWPDLLDHLLDLLGGLGHAHARGVVHRDIKPSNLLLAGPSDARPGIKLADFGIATAAHAEDDRRRVTGTPRYMAPEQFRGDARAVGPWTDLYALGCVVWELVTGAPPYAGSDPTRLAHAHLYDEPVGFYPRVSVPEALESWIRRCLEKDPGDRFLRAADAAWALSGLGPAVPAPSVLAVPPSWLRPPEADRDPADTLDDLILDLAPELLTPQGPPPMAVEPPPIPESHDGGSRASATRTIGGLGLFGLLVPALVGRSDERELLWEALRDVHRTGHARVVVLQGPAGCGKSALARWLAEHAEEVGAADALIATHGPLPTPTHGLSAMLARELRVVGLPWPRVLDGVARFLRRHDVRDATEATALAALIAPDDEHGPAWSGSAERLALLTRTLGLRAQERPQIVVLDDAHWAADAVDWVTWTLDRARHQPILIVLAARTDDPDAPAEEAVAELVRRRGVGVIPVGPLRDGDVRSLIDQLLPLQHDLADRLTAAADGNPQYAVQVLADWVDRDVLHAAPGGLQLTDDSNDQLPGDLREIWIGRLQHALGPLPPRARAWVEIAAALGEAVVDDEWRAAGREGNLPPVPELRARLVAARLIVPSDGSWRFAHALLRDVVEEHARQAGRWPAVQRACARMLLGRPEHPARLARVGHHQVEAGDLEGGLTTLLEAARRRLLKDEARTAGLLADRAAWVCERLGLEAGDGRRGVLRLLRARVKKSAFDLDGAHQLVQAVADDALTWLWPRLEAEAAAEAADLHRLRGDLPAALTEFRRALARYQVLRDDQGVADTMRATSAVVLQLGQLVVAERLLHEAQARYTDLGDRYGVGMVLAGLGDLARARGAWDLALERFHASLAQLQGLGHRSGVALGLHGIAEVSRLTGDLDAAEEGYRQVIRLDTALGRDNSVSRLNLALCQIERDQLPEATTTLQELQDEWRDRPGYLAVVHAAWLVVRALRREWPAMAMHLDAIGPLLQATSLVEVDIARAAERAGDIAASSDRPQEARRAWTIAHHQWRDLGQHDAVTRVEQLLFLRHPDEAA